jgi:hypothetical protein
MSTSAKPPLASPPASDDDVSKIDSPELSERRVDGAAAPIDPLAGVPELTSYTAASEEDKVDALKLIADSVAQQRQVAARILTFHPLCLAIFTVVLAVISQYIYTTPRDLPRVATTWAGLVMAYLVGVRMFTKEYLNYAEDVNWAWLDGDRIIVTKFGDAIIGALVLGWVSGDGRGSRRKRVGRGLIRAWTVKMRYRGKGVGTGLLEEAVGLVNEKGGDGIDFAEEHASTLHFPRLELHRGANANNSSPDSKRALKDFFNTPFDKRDIRAQKALDEVARQKGTFVKRGSR